jgi:hypothetical protein
MTQRLVYWQQCLHQTKPKLADLYSNHKKRYKAHSVRDAYTAVGRVVVQCMHATWRAHCGFAARKGLDNHSRPSCPQPARRTSRAWLASNTSNYTPKFRDPNSETQIPRPKFRDLNSETQIPNYNVTDSESRLESRISFCRISIQSTIVPVRKSVWK